MACSVTRPQPRVGRVEYTAAAAAERERDSVGTRPRAGQPGPETPGQETVAMIELSPPHNGDSDWQC